MGVRSLVRLITPMLAIDETANECVSLECKWHAVSDGKRLEWVEGRGLCYEDGREYGGREAFLVCEDER